MGALISPLATLATSILDRVLPDKAANDAAKNTLAQMALSGELQQAESQLEINKTEAASQSTFVAGWRPAVGWVCCAGVAYEMVFRPLLTFVVLICNGHFEAPHIELQDLLTMMGTLLGFGAMRSYDKAQGSTTSGGH